MKGLSTSSFFVLCGLFSFVIILQLFVGSSNGQYSFSSPSLNFNGYMYLETKQMNDSFVIDVDPCYASFDEYGYDDYDNNKPIDQGEHPFAKVKQKKGKSENYHENYPACASRKKSESTQRMKSQLKYFKSTLEGEATPLYKHLSKEQAEKVARRKAEEHIKNRRDYTTPAPQDLGLSASQQINGSMPGGLIRILNIDWSQAARDDTTRIAQYYAGAHEFPFTKRKNVNKKDVKEEEMKEKKKEFEEGETKEKKANAKRGLFLPNYGYNPMLENLAGVQGAGRVCVTKPIDNISPILMQYAQDNKQHNDIRDAVCPPPQAFFVVLSSAVQGPSGAGNLYYVLDAAVVQSYSISLDSTEGPNAQTEETVCFWAPLIITSFTNPAIDSSFEDNLSYVCEPNFCEEYCCVCGAVCFGSGGELLNAYCGNNICHNIPWQAECFAHLPGGYEKEQSDPDHYYNGPYQYPTTFGEETGGMAS